MHHVAPTSRAMKALKRAYESWECSDTEDGLLAQTPQWDGFAFELCGLPSDKEVDELLSLLCQHLPPGGHATVACLSRPFPPYEPVAAQHLTQTTPPSSARTLEQRSALQVHYPRSFVFVRFSRGSADAHQVMRTIRHSLDRSYLHRNVEWPTRNVSAFDIKVVLAGVVEVSQDVQVRSICGRPGPRFVHPCRSWAPRQTSSTWLWEATHVLLPADPNPALPAPAAPAEVGLAEHIPPSDGSRQVAVRQVAVHACTLVGGLEDNVERVAAQHLSWWQGQPVEGLRHGVADDADLLSALPWVLDVGEAAELFRDRGTIGAAATAGGSSLAVDRARHVHFRPQEGVLHLKSRFGTLVRFGGCSASCGGNGHTVLFGDDPRDTLVSGNAILGAHVRAGYPSWSIRSPRNLGAHAALGESVWAAGESPQPAVNPFDVEPVSANPFGGISSQASLNEWIDILSHFVVRLAGHDPVAPHCRSSNSDVVATAESAINAAWCKAGFYLGLSVVLEEMARLNSVGADMARAIREGIAPRARTTLDAAPTCPPGRLVDPSVGNSILDDGPAPGAGLFDWRHLCTYVDTSAGSPTQVAVAGAVTIQLLRWIFDTPGCDIKLIFIEDAQSLARTIGTHLLELLLRRSRQRQCRLVLGLPGDISNSIRDDRFVRVVIDNCDTHIIHRVGESALRELGHARGVPPEWQDEVLRSWAGGSKGLTLVRSPEDVALVDVHERLRGAGLFEQAQ